MPSLETLDTNAEVNGHPVEVNGLRLQLWVNNGELSVILEQRGTIVSEARIPIREILAGDDNFCLKVKHGIR